MTNRLRYRIPPNPVLSIGSFRDGGASEDRRSVPITHGRNVLWLTSARLGLAHIFRHLGVGPGTRVLLPIYNCQSMVLPVEWLGGEPSYYRVNADLSPVLEDLEELAGDDVKCLVITHYFGFPLAMERISEFAARRSIPLVEDCAHALFGDYEGRPLGSFGDYAVCSPWKFLPLLDGGCVLLGERANMEVTTSPGSVSFQLGAVMNSIENSLQANRFGAVSPLVRIPVKVKDWVMRAMRPDRGQSESSSMPQSAHGGAEFESEWMDVRTSWFSRFLFGHVSLPRVVAGRRDNYRRLLHEFHDDARCCPVFPDLPDQVVPYVFPVYVPQGDAVYYRLREKGVPVFRWDEIPGGICDVGSDYRERLIQLPVHQELLPSEIDWIVATVRETLDATRDGQRSVGGGRAS